MNKRLCRGTEAGLGDTVTAVSDAAGTVSRTTPGSSPDEATNAANKLALETIGIPLVDVGTGLDAAFFQAWKGVNAIQNGNTTGGAGDLAGSALSLFGGKILSKIGGSLVEKRTICSCGVLEIREGTRWEWGVKMV